MARHYLVVDVESTAPAGQPATAKDGEVVELGAGLAEAAAGAVFAEQQSLVRPASTAGLEATAIAATELERAPDFPAVMARLEAEILARHQVALTTWGDPVVRMLERDSKRHRLRFPFAKHRVDLQQLFAEHRHCRLCSVRQALEMCRLEPTGRERRALDDARNVARVLKGLV